MAENLQRKLKNRLKLPFALQHICILTVGGTQFTLFESLFHRLGKYLRYSLSVLPDKWCLAASHKDFNNLVSFLADLSSKWNLKKEKWQKEDASNSVCHCTVMECVVIQVYILALTFSRWRVTCRNLFCFHVWGRVPSIPGIFKSGLCEALT